MAIKIEYFYVFINNFVSSSKKYSVYLTITDWVISSIGICVCRLYVLDITPLSEIVLLRKSNFSYSLRCLLTLSFLLLYTRF